MSIERSTGVQVESNLGWVFLVPDMECDVACLDQHCRSHASIAFASDIFCDGFDDLLHADCFNQIIQEALGLIWPREWPLNISINDEMFVLDHVSPSDSD